MSHLDIDTATGRQVRRRRYNLLDGIDSQAGSSKPTVRSDGTTLQTGDRWLSTGDRLWWYWNGTYWLSEQVFTATCSLNSTSANAQPGILATISSYTYNLYFLTFEYTSYANANQNSTDYWTVDLQRALSSGTVTAIVSNTFNGFSITSSFIAATFKSTLNLHQDLSALSPIGYRMAMTRNGAAGALFSIVGTLRYRLVKP